MHNIGKRDFFIALGKGLLHFIFSLFVILSSIWLCLALWVQEPVSWLVTRILIGSWIAFAISVLGIYASQHFFSRRINSIIYILCFMGALSWYIGLDARQDRDWNPEVSRLLEYERQGDQVTLHNVRNFAWEADGKVHERWETRHFDLNQITGINIITSYWMGPQIAHTLVSFDFANQEPLTFSIEIRKERNEEFSAIGGFFRQYELSLVASDEQDIIYTRSNIRHQQVYFFPIRMSASERKALFLEYLKTADELRAEPQWYNTLTSNCTTIIFDMVQAINPYQLPKDYRLLASGYLPEYLYDLYALDHQWSIQEWYQHAHINPRTEQISQNPEKIQQFSQLMRQGLPSPLP
ncbi:DUF4105 domain-containing protein [Acinetobacter radioresistens]|uniref:Lnb N-terminal periplasmic domain-containing protein n=1 Tax=Acinetobacter radioresistens TaxID=40216 RepID=UPI003B2803B1